MKLRYKIEDLEACDFVVDFEFHKEIDGEILFDSAYDIIFVTEYWWEDNFLDCRERKIDGNDYPLINRWLSNGGEDTIYRLAKNKE